MDSKVTINKKLQFICISAEDISPKKPINDFTPIISNEVPIAFLIGIFAYSTNIGIMIKPPPAPTKPVAAPSNKPSKDTKIAFIRETVSSEILLTLDFLMIERAANSINTEKNNIKKRSLEMTTSPNSIMVSGNAGNRYLRLKNTEIMDGIPKSAAIFKDTSLLWYFGYTPTRLVVPTIKSE